MLMKVMQWQQKISNLPSLNNGLKCRKPVFMRVSGICFIEWLIIGGG